jgi:hypothetical protein
MWLRYINNNRLRNITTINCDILFIIYRTDLCSEFNLDVDIYVGY